VRTLDTLPSLRNSRNPVVAVGIFVVVIIAAYQAAQVVLSGDFSAFAYLALGVVAVAFSVMILNDWHKGLYIFIAWILFEDFARKFLGNNMAIYFAKDFLVLLLYASFYRARLSKKYPRFRVPFGLALGAFFWFCLLQVFNPASTSVYFGILGMKIWFLYVPLMYIGYAFIESEQDLQRLIWFTSVLCLIVAGLGLAQSIIGPKFLNPTVIQEDIRDMSTLYRIAPISGVLAYRPTSVFVSAGRFQDFLIVSWAICLGFCGYVLLRTKKHRFLVFATAGTIAAASVMSASRGVFMWNSGIALVVAAGFLWGAPWRQREVLRVLRAIQRMALVSGIAILLLLTLAPEQIGSRLAIYSETLMPNSPSSEIVTRTKTYPLRNMEKAFAHPRWPYGYGTGTCTLGIQYVARIFHVAPMPIGVEGGYGNILIELGIVGLVLWIVLGTAVSFCAWKVVLELKGTPWFPVSFVIFLFSVLLFFPMTFVSSAYQDYLTNALFWLFTGLIYKLKQFPKAYALDVAPQV